MPRFKQVKVKAIEGTPNAGRDQLKVYTVELPAEVVAKFRVERALDVEGGFQRPLNAASARKIGLLMGGSAKRDELPEPNIHNSLLAFADEDEIMHRGGWLTLKNPLRLIDGQTRAAGAQWAVENGSVSDYTETVKIVVGATRMQVVNWFLMINMTQRRVPPQNILLNVATLSGVVRNKKSWLARETITLSTDDPFTMGEGRHLVSFAPKDEGRISALTLYKALQTMLPADLNAEGEIEERALQYARDGFKLYAEMYDKVWGAVDDDGNFVHHDCYEFTLMLAFARLYRDVVAQMGHSAKTDNAIKRAWHKAELDKGLPEGVGSGERAATSLANHVADEMKITIAA